MAAPSFVLPVMAGSRFGLSAEELAEKYGLDEDTSEGIVQEFGETQPFKTSTTTYKDRGNVLGFRTGGRPTTTETVFARAALPTISQAETTPELKQFTGTVGGVPITDIGQQGFGMKDYNAAVAAGYDPESIKDWVTANKSSLYNIGPEAQKQLGIEGYVSTTPGVFDYSEYGQSGFGMKDVQALQEKGVPEETMRTLAAQAPKVGPEAAKQLNYTPSSQQFLNATLESFDYGAAGQAGFGMEDVKSLMSKGATTEQMRELARRAPGGQVGPAARELLGL